MLIVLVATNLDPEYNSKMSAEKLNQRQRELRCKYTFASVDSVTVTDEVTDHSPPGLVIFVIWS
jgi:hypothetical protein